MLFRSELGSPPSIPKAAVGMEGGDPNSVNNLKRPTDWEVTIPDLPMSFAAAGQAFPNIGPIAGGSPSTLVDGILPADCWSLASCTVRPDSAQRGGVQEKWYALVTRLTLLSPSADAYAANDESNPTHSHEHSSTCSAFTRASIISAAGSGLACEMHGPAHLQCPLPPTSLQPHTASVAPTAH